MSENVTQDKPPDQPAWIVNYEDPRGVYPWRRESLDSRESADRNQDDPPIRVGPYELTINLHDAPASSRHQLLVGCLPWVAMLLWLFALYLVRWLAPTSSRWMAAAASSGILWISMAEWASPLLWRLGGRRREAKMVPILRALDNSPSLAACVFVRGCPSELLRFTVLPDAGFEPWVRAVWFRPIVRNAFTRSMLLIAIAVVVGAFTLRGGVATLWMSLPPALACSAPLLMLLLLGIPRRPRYFRVIPGRLDIMDCGWLSSRVRQTSHVDLRNARTSIDLSEKNAFIYIFTEGRAVAFHREDVPSPLDFAVVLAWATATTAPTPDIPMDRLIG